jgi:PBSX family phage portal protein
VATQRKKPSLPPASIAESAGTDASEGYETGLVKAFYLGGGDDKGKSLLEALMSGGQLPGDALVPPYDPGKLYQLFEFSSILRPNVDAYVTNIESFGHHLIPAIDLSASDADVRIADAIFYERYLAVRDGESPATELKEPSEDEVNARREELRRTARLEFPRLRAFFSFACSESFVELRRKSRQDLEVTGNAYWEVVRDRLNEIRRFHYVSTIQMRLLPIDKAETRVAERSRVSDISWVEEEEPHFFRRFVQLPESQEDTAVFFKEFGDPRTVSRKTGKYYASPEEMKKKEPDALPATEIVHFRIFTPSSPYGVPRWIGTLPSVLGSRELDEVNYGYFRNNVVPPLALLVAGGRFAKGVAERIEQHIEEHLKGRKGINRILVLEAEGQRGGSDIAPRTIPKMQFVPLRDVQQTDALFQEYDANNAEKVARAFRLPRILRGDDSKTNKATAWASLRFAEEEVFEPEREHFDNFINRKVFTDLGITFWLFRSNAAIVRDPETMALMVSNLVKVGVLLPREAREIMSDIFNHPFTEISEDWTNRPLPLIIAQLKGLLPEIATSAEEVEEEPAQQTASRNRPQLAQSTTHPAGRPLRILGGSEDEV